MNDQPLPEAGFGFVGNRSQILARIDRVLHAAFSPEGTVHGSRSVDLIEKRLGGISTNHLRSYSAGFQSVSSHVRVIS